MAIISPLGNNAVMNIVAVAATTSTEWWLNPWLIGVGSAIISGLVVNFISRLIWSRRDNSDLRQKIDAANNEVIYALRPSVAEGSMPSKEILASLISATARKYSLKSENLMTVNEFADGLIKEVMDSNFISHEQKIKYASEVIVIKESKKEEPSTPATTIRLGTSDPLYIYRKRLFDRSTLLLSIAAALITFVAAALTALESGSSKLSIFSQVDDSLAPILGAALILPAVLGLYGVSVFIKKMPPTNSGVLDFMIDLLPFGGRRTKKDKKKRND